MNYFEMIENACCMKLSDLIVIAIPMLMRAHHWNGEDRPSQIYKQKEELAKRLLPPFVEIGYISNNVIDLSTIGEVDINDTDNITISPIEYFAYLYKYLQLNGHMIPDDLNIILNTDSGRNMIHEIMQDDSELSLESLIEVDMKLGNIEVTSLNLKNTGKQQYRFEKTSQSWDIQFGDEILRGVKDYVGMQYIKQLLQSPRKPIGVIELQAMSNPLSINAPGKNILEHFEDHDDQQISIGGGNPSKSAALNNMRDRLQRLAKEREELEDYEHFEIEKIDNEVARIETEMDNIRYSKNEDPELETNRKKIYKNITDAYKNIKRLEEKQGFDGTPIFLHLDRYIDKGVVCIYDPPADNIPPWSF